MLRSISATDLVLDTGDDRVIPVQIPDGTKYLSTMDKVKASDFQPGDHVTVDATHDDSGHYRCASITLNKKGTAEDKERARQRATEMAKASTAPPANSPSNPSSNQAGGSGDPSASGRPRLQRANSGGSDTAGAQTSSASASGDAGYGSPGSVPSSTAGSGGSRPTAASAQPDSAASTADNSGPPVLRRSPPANSSSVPVQQTASGGRPSLSAEDVNGVTRAPASPAAPNVGPDGELHRSSDDDLIEQTRQEAFSFTQSLPNYVVKQITTRYRSNSSSRGLTPWQALDVITADVVYLDGKENYSNIMDNGKPTRDASQNGSWSEGEFASSLQALLSPFSATDFRNKRPVTIVNRPAYKVDYTIEQEHSAWRIQTDGQTYQPSYSGSIWIDKETYRVLRIEMASRNMPRWFPIDTAESSIDYDFVRIGDQNYLLPVHSESLSCWRGTSQCSRNVIDFRNYKKYTADASISFGDTVPDK